MSSRRPTSGQGARNAAPPRLARYAAQHFEDEENIPRSYRSNGASRRGGGRELSEYEENGSYYQSPPLSRGGRQSHDSRHGVRGQGVQREPFFGAKEKKMFGVSDGGSTVARLMKGAEKELVGWLRSEGKVAGMVNRLIKGMEAIEEKLRTESYNGYVGSVWEADDPVSGVLSEKSQDLLFRLKKLTDMLLNPSEEIATDMAEGFYLLFSAMHVLLLHPDLPPFCISQIGQVMVAATAIAMRLGDPHVLLTCTTDHLRDSENEIVLLEFQHVLYDIINSDVNGEKLYGTAHRILDAQMDILESRNDEDSAISAINVIGVISLRHPQAFKTRFWDLTDLLIGWYVGATPSDRVFSACLVAFGLFREKFKQEIDFALKMIKEFTQEMEATVKAYVKTEKKDADLEQRNTFLAFFQLYALILHSVSERVLNASRLGPDTLARQTIRTTMLAILKTFNQILQPSDPGFVSFSTRINKALVVVVNAVSIDCVPFSGPLYLHMRMQQTSAERIYNLALLHPDFVKSLFSVMSAILRATKENFPVETAKDLLGPDSLLFRLAGNPEVVPDLQKIMEALISSSQPAVRDVVLRSFRTDYRRNIRILANIVADPSLSDLLKHLMAPYTPAVEGKRRPVTRRVAVFGASPGTEVVSGKDFGEKLTALCDEDSLFLCPEGSGEGVAEENVRGVLNFETVGQYTRKRILVYLLLVEMCLKNLASADAVSLDQEFTDGFYRVLMVDMTPNWAEKFPDLVMAHISLAQILWQKKCTTLAVKELMSTARSTAGINSSDHDLMRSTLAFLDGILNGKAVTVVQRVTVDWSSHALKTLIAFTTRLADLGIEAEYLKLLADFIYLSFCGDDALRKQTVVTVTELYRSHWSKLEKTITTETLELIMGLNYSPSAQQVALADLLISKASLQTVLAYSYDVRRENTALLQMEQVAPSSFSLPHSTEKFPVAFLGQREICLPFQRNIRLWKRFLGRGRGLGSGDAHLADSLMVNLLRVRHSRICDDIKQIIESGYGFTEWTSALTTTMATAFFCLVSDVANSICHQKLPGLLSSLSDTVQFIEILFQTYAPIPVDHMSFIHKSLLDFYVHMKDISIDASDDWEEIRRLADETAEQDVVPTSTGKKPAEKRRIYARMGGITAEDVAGLPLVSWLDVRLAQKRVFLFSAAVERNISRMIHGSALHLISLTDDDWRAHTSVISASYRTTDQIAGANSTLKNLRIQMLRMAIVLDDDFSVVRLGYPVLLDVLKEGHAEHVNVEELSATLLWALIRLQSSHLIAGIQAAQLVSEVESGISGTAFVAAHGMADNEFEQALQALLLSIGEGPSDIVETNLAADCFIKLNDWDGLERMLSTTEVVSERTQEQFLLARCVTADDYQPSQEDISLIHCCLDGSVESRKNAAEICALIGRQHPEYGIAREAAQSLRAVQKLSLMSDIPKFDHRSAVLLHVLDRLASGEQRNFPLNLDLKHVDIQLLHTFGRLNFGGDRESALYCRAVVKFGRRTENHSMVQNALTGYFAKHVPDCAGLADADPERFLQNMLLLASSSAVHVDDVRLIRQGGSHLAESGNFDGALAVGKQVCFDAFRLIQEVPDDSGAFLTEISKNIGRIGNLSTTFGNSDQTAAVKDSIADIRFPLDSLYEQSGFALEMFVENHAASPLAEQKDEISGILAEMAYMTHCMEGTYSKPALNFGNWCYEQGYRMLTALSRLTFDDIVSTMSTTYPEQDHSLLTPGVTSRVLQLFMDCLPIRTGRQEIKAVLEVMRNGLPDWSAIFHDEFLMSQGCPVSVSSCLLSYCQAQYAQIVELLTRACHMYFIYLRTPARDDLATVVTLRLLELLTALPESVGGIWLEELPKHDVAVWRSCLTLLLSRLYHQHELVVAGITAVVAALAVRFPDEVLYPVVVGNMIANDTNIGGGACCPALTFHQRTQLISSYDQLMEKLAPGYDGLLNYAATFSTEIQRLSLLWEERWLQYLVSHQGLIKKELRAAIRDATETSAGIRRAESEESLEDSAADDLGFPDSYSVELNLSSTIRSGGDQAEQVGVEDVDIEGLKRQNSDLVVRSRDVTPDIPEVVKDDVAEGDGRKDGRRHIRFPLYESVPWKTRFNGAAYKAAVEPVLRRLRALLDLCGTNPETQAEFDFVKHSRQALLDALEKIANPSLSAEFDEDVLWIPFAQIMTDLEERQAVKRKTGLRLGDISRLTELVKDCVRLPVPGWSGGSGRTAIACIDDRVAILPTKTKPKKLAFWGTDGYKHSFLCKGLEDLTQDARIMHFLDISNKFLKRAFKHTKGIDRARTYSVISFGPRAGLIQWVDGSTSMLSLYRSHLERETVLERQILATKDDNFTPEVPSYPASTAKGRENEPPPTVTFRVTEDDLQEIYETIQEERFNEPPGDSTMENTDTALEPEPELDPFEKWIDSEDEFSPQQFTNVYYNTLLQKSKKELRQFHMASQLPLRGHPHIHELYMSYVVQSLRRDTTIDWEKFRLHEKNCVKDVGLEHLKNALLGLLKNTPKQLLAREIKFACSSSEEWWMVSRGYVRSLAITSVLGYVLGVGDRHPDNVLIDFHTGEVVHVDYNIAFEKGVRLSVPELVPYRLTQNLVHALGWDGTEGSFRDVAVQTLETLRKNQSALSQLMTSYLVDPLLDWTTDKSDLVGLNPRHVDSDDVLNRKKEKATLFGVKVWHRVRDKLLGIDGPDNTRSSVPDQVDWTIATATDTTNLARMFEGWVAWL